jgi:predicted PurR-regulated permease PerM
VVIPFWLFYILKDRHKIGPMIQNWFPPGLRGDVDACINIVRRVLGSYIRAQLTLGVFIGVITTVGLWTMDRLGWVEMQYAVVLGIIAGITELVPVIGPIIGAIPAIIITLATDPEKAWIVLLFYVVVQQVENAVLVPRIQGQAVEMHPAIIIVLLVVAQQVAGFLGMIVAVPLAAVSRDLYKYIYHRLQEREQELAHPRVLRLERPPPLASSPPAAIEPEPPAERASSE